MPERDLFANFERMRREVDELFGDVFERTGLSRRRGGFSPAVDVAYAADPPRAIVTAELPGVDLDQLGLEIQGRVLILAGHRGPACPEGDVYQMLAYCTRLGLGHGHLIYVAGPQPSATLHVANRDIAITRHALSLEATPDLLLAQITAIADRMRMASLSEA